MFYYGWVPNVAGRLSFSIAGLSNYLNKIVFGGDLEDAGTHFIGFQKRNLSDTSIPFTSERAITRRFVDKHILKKNGDFVFLCLMKHAKSRDALVGKVYLYLDQVWDSVERDVIQVISLIENQPDPDLRLNKAIGSSARSKALCSALFTIECNGVLTLNPQTLPENFSPERFSNLEQTICSQIYFFIRDLLHTHKFHSPTTDRILDIYKDKSSWQNSVNYALARKAIQLRRSNDPMDLQKSLGIVSYLESFRLNVMSSADSEKLKFSLIEFKTSINNYMPIARAKFEARITQRLNRFVNKLITFLAALVAAIVTLGKNSPSIGAQDDFINTVFVYLNDNTLSFLVISSLLLAVFKLFVPDTVYVTKKPARNWARLAMYTPKLITGVVGLIMSSIIFIIGSILIIYFLHAL